MEGLLEELGLEGVRIRIVLEILVEEVYRERCYYGYEFILIRFFFIFVLFCLSF